MALLDESGLKYLWSQLKTKFAMASHTHDAATKSAAGMMSAADKTKLDGIAEKANNYSHPTSAGNKHIPAGGSAGKILGWASDGAAQWVDDKNTTYSNFKGATSSAAGGSGLVPAPAAGGQSTQYLRADGAWAVPPNTTYANATQGASGLMSGGDKTKLDGIAAGANKYSHPGYTSKSNGFYKVTVDGTGHVSATTAVTKSDITGLGIPAQDTTYSAATSSTLGLVRVGSNISNSYGTISLTKANVTNALGYTPPTQDTTYGLATTSSNGLMSYSDKSKLNGLSNITVDTELSASSTNPVQNKVVYANNLWLYRAYFSVDSWTASGDQYYQGAYVYAQDGGPTLPAGATLSTPMTAQNSNLSTNETLQATLNIINAGYATVSRSGYVTVYVSEKPTSDIYVYWYAR